jgi:ABC-type Fe3+-hydroxamate transport system substrate-binding protein
LEEFHVRSANPANPEYFYTPLFPLEYMSVTGSTVACGETSYTLDFPVTLEMNPDLIVASSSGADVRRGGSSSLSQG